MSFYPVFFRLDPAERIIFDSTFDEDPLLEQAVASGATRWRHKLEPCWQSRRQCREVFCAESLVRLSKRALEYGYSVRLMQAIVMEFTDRVEERVNQENECQWN